MKTPELEARIIYSLIVAGKSAKFADAAIRRFLGGGIFEPFKTVRHMRNTGTLERGLREGRTGNYGKLCRALSELVDANLNLARCSPADLEEIHGIGPKTSRFFISRP